MLLTGCVTGDELYGPAEWLAEHAGANIQSIHPDFYEKVWNPEITIYVGNLEPCYAEELACAYSSPDRCDVYLPERYSTSLKAHELKHCYGWAHTRGEVLSWYKKEVSDEE